MSACLPLSGEGGQLVLTSNQRSIEGIIKHLKWSYICQNFIERSQTETNK